MSLPKPHTPPSTAREPARDASPPPPRNTLDHPRRFVVEREQRIDDELAQSFPASDPPGWVLGSARPPR